MFMAFAGWSHETHCGNAAVGGYGHPQRLSHRNRIAGNHILRAFDKRQACREIQEATE
jgi:hypothetical protein